MPLLVLPLPSRAARRLPRRECLWAVSTRGLASARAAMGPRTGMGPRRRPDCRRPESVRNAAACHVMRSRAARVPVAVRSSARPAVRPRPPTVGAYSHDTRRPRVLHAHPDPRASRTAMPAGRVAAAVRRDTGAGASLRTAITRRPRPPAVGMRVTLCEGTSDAGLSVTSMRTGVASYPRCPEMVTRTSPMPGRAAGRDGRMVTCITPTVPPGATGAVVVTPHTAAPDDEQVMPVGDCTACRPAPRAMGWRTRTVAPAGRASPPRLTMRTWYVKGS